LAQPATGTARYAQDASTVAGLARFFPEASPVRMPVQLARVLQGSEPAAAHFAESIVIEFGTPREVLFACNTPLEFGDDLRLRTPTVRSMSPPRSWRCSISPAKP